MKTLRLFIALCVSFGFFLPAYAAMAQDQAKNPAMMSQSGPSSLNKTAVNRTKVDINKASVSQLMTLTGVGEQKAAAIVAYRNKNGKFKSIMDLANVKGISNNIIAHNRNRLTLGG